jgi:hypothetical protein
VIASTLTFQKEIKGTTFFNKTIVGNIQFEVIQ